MFIRHTHAHTHTHTHTHTILWHLQVPRPGTVTPGVAAAASKIVTHSVGVQVGGIFLEPKVISLPENKKLTETSSVAVQCMEEEPPKSEAQIEHETQITKLKSSLHLAYKVEKAINCSQTNYCSLLGNIWDAVSNWRVTNSSVAITRTTQDWRWAETNIITYHHHFALYTGKISSPFMTTLNPSPSPELEPSPEPELSPVQPIVVSTMRYYRALGIVYWVWHGHHLL